MELVFIFMSFCSQLLVFHLEASKTFRDTLFAAILRQVFESIQEKYYKLVNIINFVFHELLNLD